MIPEEVEITTLLSILIGIVLLFLLGVSWVQIRAEHRIGELEREKLIMQMTFERCVDELKEETRRLIIEKWRVTNDPKTGKPW